MKKNSPAFPLIKLCLTFVITASLAGRPALALDYFNYGNNGSSIAAANQYSNIDGSTTNATLAPSSSSNDLFFFNSTVGSSGALTLDTMGAINMNSMTFRSNVGSIQINRMTGNDTTTTALLSNYGGGITLEAGSGPVTFGGVGQRVAIGAQADFTITNNSSSDLTFNREVLSYTANTTRTITVAGSGSGNTIFYDIRTSSSGRETAMTIGTSGSGIVKFVGNNTYLGATTITAGTLQIGDGGTAGALATGSAITNNGTLVFNRSNTVTQGTNFASAIAGTGHLTQAGSGTLILSGNNTYTGTTTVSAGTLTLNNAANNDQTIQGDILVEGGLSTYGTVDNQIADSSNVTITSGSLNMGSRTETINSLTMSGGELNTPGILTLASSSTFTGGSLVRQTSSNSAQKITTNGITTLGNTTFSYSHGSTNAGGGLFLNGGILVQAGATADFTNLSVGAGRINLNDADRVFDIGAGATMNVDWLIRSTAEASGSLTKNGSGTLNLTNQNVYSGGTTINDGTIVLGHASNTLSAGAVTINGGTLSIGSNSDTVGTITLAGGDITGTTGVLTGSSYELQSGNVSAILGGASVSATKTTGGTVTLSGNNTYTGDTTIEGGTLEIAASGSLGAGAYAGNITNNATFIYSGSNAQEFSGVISGTGAMTYNASSTLTLTGSNTYSGDITISTGTIEIGAAGRLGAGSYSGNISNNGTFIYSGTNAQTLSGTISGTGALTQNASSTLTLTGNNSYTGTTTIHAGTIRLQNTASNSQTIVGDITISGGQLTLAATNQIADTASVTLTSGSVELSVYNETIDSLTMSGGSLRRSSNTLALNSASSFTGGTVNFASNTSRISTAGTTTLGDVTFDFSVASGTSTLGLQLGGNIAVNASTTANFTNSGGGLGRIDLNGADRTIDVGSGATANVGWNIDGAGYGLIKDGAGTLTLSASSTYTGGTTLNTGTFVIGNTAAAGSGTITQTDGTSLLKFDTTGTIANAMSIYNVSANKTVTLSGGITVNNAVFDVASGETLTISNTINGTGGVTKNGNGTLVLSGNNTYSAPTVLNAGTLNAAHAGALGANTTVTVNDGTLLVSTDDAINGRQITLNGTSTTVATLAFSSNYTGSIGKLTLSADSIIDLGQGNIGLQFADMAMGFYNLSIYNWSGTTQWGTTYGTGTDQLYFNGDYTASNVRFYSGAVGSDSFVGSGFDLGLQQTSWDSGLSGHYILPVPEPETWATALLLLLGGAWMLAKHSRKVESAGPFS